MFDIGPAGALRVFGVTLIGANAENGKKLLLTIGFVAAILFLGWALRLLISGIAKLSHDERISFWGRQGVNILAALLLFVSVVSIWFNDPTRLTTALGLFTAGIAFALQRVITATVCASQQTGARAGASWPLCLFVGRWRCERIMPLASPCFASLLRGGR